MEKANDWIALILPYLPTAVTGLLVTIALFVVKKFFDKRERMGHGRQIHHQLILLLLTLVALIMVIVALPIADSTKGNLLSLLGILLSAAIALSATTFVGNAMAGVMLRALRNFRTGDFVRVGELFGRVSERGLFHTEIQNEERNLITLPNLHLVTNPVTVIRSSGTILTGTVSLGYDVPQRRTEKVLLEAGELAGLSEPFVHVVELGDFSVTYRLGGLLTEVKGLISARSRLNRMMLHCLHGDGIEIVSPNFMNQRIFDPASRFVPIVSASIEDDPRSGSPEALAFDKADAAESLEQIRQDVIVLSAELDELEKKLGDKDVADRERLERRKAVLDRRRDRLRKVIELRAHKEDIEA